MTKTEFGISFPIQVIVRVFFSSYVETQIDSKSKTTRLFQNLLSLETLGLNPSSLPNKVLQTYTLSLRKDVSAS